MTEQPEIAGVLRRVLTGAANLMARQTEGPTTRGTHRFDYRDAIENDRSAVAAFLRHTVEEVSDGKRTARAADRALFAEVPENAVMLVVVCDTPRAEGKVTALQRNDQLYAVEVPPGNVLAVEVSKQFPRA
jgi:hypothetical protein